MTPSYAPLAPQAMAKRPKQLAGIAAAIVLGSLWLGPLPQLSHTTFSAHMLLHLGLITVAAPLLAFALSNWSPVVSSSRAAWMVGLIASAAELVVVWGWHAPLLHVAAARELPVFLVQQLSFLAVGVAVWTLPFIATSRAASLVAAVVLFLTFTHMSMFGLVLTLAPRVLYAADVCGGGWGLSSLTDQQLGGAMMTIGGGLPYLAGAVAIAYRFFAEVPVKGP